MNSTFTKCPYCEKTEFWITEGKPTAQPCPSCGLRYIGVYSEKHNAIVPRFYSVSQQCILNDLAEFKIESAVKTLHQYFKNPGSCDIKFHEIPQILQFWVRRFFGSKETIEIEVEDDITDDNSDVLSKNQWLQIVDYAHKQDITINQAITLLLEKGLEDILEVQDI